jgi:predicted nucleotidyltransferase component of viral defense system
MKEIRTQQELMAALIAFIADKFPQNAVLKGGMSMKAAFNCRRHTADIDWTFIPFKSKKPVFEKIEKEIETLDYVRITGKGMRSTNAFFEISLKSRPEIRTKIEFSTEEECPTIPVSGSEFANSVDLPGFILNIISPPVAMSHKLAAWLERDEIKDIYDTYYYTISGIIPDIGVLKKRLFKVNYQRKTRLPKKMTISGFLSLLLERVKGLSEKDMQSLSPILPANELPSLKQKIQSAISRLAFEIENREKEDDSIAERKNKNKGANCKTQNRCGL